jgi:hypothetical protein
MAGRCSCWRAMTVTSRRWLSVLAGVVSGLLFLMPWGCADVGGVSSWERCTSTMGTPVFSVEDWGVDSNLNIFVPVVPGLLVGIGTCWRGRMRRSDGR